MRILISVILLISLLTSNLFSQTKSFKAEKISGDKNKIDGIADDDVWKTIFPATGFTQWHPNPGIEAKNRTEVRLAYDDAAIYVFAIMYINEDIEISQQLTERDDEGLADYFVFVFDPFGDNALSYNFGVTAAGVQFDYKRNENNLDYNWNEVWKSKVQVNDSSWTAEMEIPYSAIRFPKENKSDRKVNFIRYINDDRRRLS